MLGNKTGKLILLLGGARSGKSILAEQIASNFKEVAYIATAEAIDEEMRLRIEKHREQRPKSWLTIEVDSSLKKAIDEPQETNPGIEAIIIDCLTVYIARRMEKIPDDEEILNEVSDALAYLKQKNVLSLIVSNEVGLGLVPEYPSGRRYRDLLGKVNQKVAEQADHVLMTIAGIPIDIKELKWQLQL